MTNFVISSKKLKNAEHTYTCIDNQVGAMYAAKIIYAQNDKQLQQIKNQLDQLKQIKSKYFIQIVTYLIDKLKITIIMDLAEGSTLAFLANNTIEKFYTDYCRQLIMILTELQNYKINYVSVDPCNIYLSKKGDLKLQLCKFNQINNENQKIATGKTIFKLISQQNFQSLEQVEQSKIDKKYKILIRDLIEDKTISEIANNSRWIFSFGNNNENQIQRENIQLDEQLSKQLINKQKNQQMLKLVHNNSVLDKSNSNLSADSDIDEAFKPKNKPKGSTALVEKIKQGLFKHQNQDSSPSIGKQQSNKHISNKQIIEDIKKDSIIIPTGNKQLKIKKKVLSSSTQSDFTNSDENINQIGNLLTNSTDQEDDQYNIEYQKKCNQLCLNAYNFTMQQNIELAKSIIDQFIEMKDNFYQFYRQYLQPTLLLDLYVYCQSTVENWLYYINSIVQIAKNNWKIKSEIIILGIQSMIYQKLLQYFDPKEKQVQQIFFAISEYCQLMVSNNQQDELKVMQLFIVNKGIQIISCLLKINKIFISKKQMIDTFVQNEQYINQIDKLINLVQYCGSKTKFQVYRLCIEDDINSIYILVSFVLNLYEEQNIFNQKDKVLNFLKQYLQFVLQCTINTQAEILQKNQHVKLLATFIQKSDHETKTKLLQILNQIFNQPSNEFLNANQSILINLINEQLTLYLKTQQVQINIVLQNLQQILQLIKKFIRNSLQRTKLLFQKQTIENLDKEYQKIIQADKEQSQEIQININLFQVNAEPILLEYIKIAENLDTLSIEVRTNLVKLTLEQFVKQTKLQEQSIRAMYKLCHTYDFDRLKIDDIQSININYQYFISQIQILRTTQWNSAQLTTFLLQQLIAICQECNCIKMNIFNISFLKAILHGMKDNEQEAGFLEKGLQLFQIYFQIKQQEETYEEKNITTKIISMCEILLQHKNQSIVKIAKDIISSR